MKLGYAILYVDNVISTVAFYEKAFGMQRKFVHDSETYAEMATGSTRLAFVAKALAKENDLDFGQLKNMSEPPPFELALVSDDVEASYQKAINNGAEQLKNPIQKPWGQVVGYVKDCNGFLIEICSPMD